MYLRHLAMNRRRNEGYGVGGEPGVYRGTMIQYVLIAACAEQSRELKGRHQGSTGINALQRMGSNDSALRSRSRLSSMARMHHGLITLAGQGSGRDMHIRHE